MDEQEETKRNGAQAAESTQSATTSASLFSGIAKTVASGGKTLLQNLGVYGSNKRTIQIDYLKKVLYGLESQT